MYEVIYTVDGIQRTMQISANDSVSAQNIVTNMFGMGKVQIISVRRI